MRNRLLFISFCAVPLMLSSCHRNVENHDISDYSEFPDTPCSIITGHIRNRDIYPNTKKIDLKIPFYDRVSQTVSSWITPEDSIFFELEPYGTRVVSIDPYITYLIVHPGDSLNVDLDNSDFNNVTFSGKGAEDNEKLFAFSMRYYEGEYWSSINQHPMLEDYVSSLQEALSNNLNRLDEFIAEQNPSESLAAVCRRIIETDYYSQLLNALSLFSEKDNISDFFDISEVERLFVDECILKNQYKLAWLTAGLSVRLEPEHLQKTLAKDFDKYLKFIKNISSNKLLREMMLANAYDQLLETNDVDKFEEYFDSFNRDVTLPLLKLSIRAKYAEKKGYSLNPKVISDAILHADEPKDGVSIADENKGLTLLRKIVNESGGEVVHISIGALWCPACLSEIPYQNQMIEDYSGKPLRVVSFYIEPQEQYEQERISFNVHPNAEKFFLSEEQRMGIDQILHLGRGIPFYILIDKNGVIVDYGEHLRPSIDKTRERIENLLK